MPVKTVAVTGASGFIGRAMIPTLQARGYDVVAMGRARNSAGSAPGVRWRKFDPNDPATDPETFAGVDAVIHLAGESVAGRWSPEKKRRIRESRVNGTRALVSALAKCDPPPRVLVSSSAVGYYGDRGDESLVESSPPGAGFLADVCVEWEREARRASAHGVRSVQVRTGIVLGNGGALAQMLGPFRLGAGGPFGSGKQLVPWIALEDLVNLYVFVLEHQIEGAVNGVAPDYPTSARFAQALGHALGRPAVTPAPAFALRAVLGEFATTILASQLVIPAVAEDAGFSWKFSDLEAAMQQAVPHPQVRPPGVHVFEAEQFLAQPLERVFEFFSDAKNLERLTPPLLKFAIAKEPPRLERGAQIEYRLRIHGIPAAWKTLIAEWKPPHRFVDVQLHGPYSLWHHEHQFESVDGGVRIRDRVSYALPFEPFGDLALPLVRSDIHSIFDFRKQAILQAMDANMTVPVR